MSRSSNCPPAFANDPEVRSRFVAEAQMLASLDHPHIVPVYDYIERDGLCLLVMEQLAGGTAWTRFTTEGFDPLATCAMVLCTAVALEHAHGHGVLHRDIKPENLLFTNDRAQVKVADFGIARVLAGRSDDGDIGRPGARHPGLHGARTGHGRGRDPRHRRVRARRHAVRDAVGHAAVPARRLSPGRAVPAGAHRADATDGRRARRTEPAGRVGDVGAGDRALRSDQRRRTRSRWRSPNGRPTRSGPGGWPAPGSAPRSAAASRR